MASEHVSLASEVIPHLPVYFCHVCVHSALPALPSCSSCWLTVFSPLSASFSFPPPFLLRSALEPEKKKQVGRPASELRSEFPDWDFSGCPENWCGPFLFAPFSRQRGAAGRTREAFILITTPQPLVPPLPTPLTICYPSSSPPPPGPFPLTVCPLPYP